MKAIVHHAYGPPSEVLRQEDMPKPTPKSGEVLVRVAAAAVQAGDWVMARGVPYFMRPAYGLRSPKNIVPGFDLAGRVEAIGSAVKRFQPGDEVFGWCTGAFAEYACAEEKTIVAKPASVSFEAASATVGSAITALQALRDQGHVQPGQKVLVVGASGGVGTSAVQLAKYFGAEVTGVCSTKNVDMVRSLGADHVIDYTKEELTQRDERYDLVLDIAGNRPVSLLRRALTRKGMLILVGGRGGPWFMGMGRIFGALALSPFVRHQLRFFVAQGTQADLVFVKERLVAGDLSPVIDKTYPLHRTPEAVGYVDRGHTRGKVVIAVESSTYES